MGTLNNTFQPLSARNLVAAGLAPLFENDAKGRQLFSARFTAHEVEDAPVFTVASGTQALIVFRPYLKARRLFELLGEKLLLQKLLAGHDVDNHLGHAVARIALTPSAPKKPGQIEVIGWHASARASAELRKLRPAPIPPGLNITYAKRVLEAA